MTEHALPAPVAQDSEATHAASPALPGHGVEDAQPDPRVELGQLRRAMRTRPVIDMARGILMASFGLGADDAWSVLVSVSQNTNTKLHIVAADLVGAATGGRIPRPLRRQLAAAVAQLRPPTVAPHAEER
ncbi:MULTISPECIES: ANTAR domain-containing protein [unclassified Streptomyces]|uniref:ANTAR domain-containing protein n=1 Tax=unclassified Streptomyces TaxID=2593676 RepID=UPI0033216B8C